MRERLDRPVARNRDELKGTFSLWSKKRRTINHQQQLSYGGICPTFSVSPISEGKMRLMVFLNTKGTSYRPYHMDVRTKYITEFLLEFEECPEAFLKWYFKYEGPDHE